MLRIEHLTKTYGEKKAVDDLSLHIEPGQIYGFIGHNGAGKTTTIKACCGILKFDAGEICIDGKSIKTQALECKREMAYIPDNPEFELTDDLAQPISAYSHGMKQKLALISALIHEPKLIIMDEPFVGLDPIASHKLKTIMREHCDRGGAIFFSTHVLEVAEKLCDMVAIIKGGKLVVSGTMEEVRGDDSLEEVFLELEED